MSTYLVGNERRLLLKTATFFLGRYSVGHSGYRDDFEMIFGRYNEAFCAPLARKLHALSRAENAEFRLTHPRVSLRFFEEAFNLPGDPVIKDQPQFEQDVCRGYAALNTQFVQQQDTALAAAKQQPELQQVPELAVLSLASAHADFDIINQENVGLLMLVQMLKAIRLFQFLETTPVLEPVLTAFLNYYNCPSWQQYLHRLLPAVMPAVQSQAPGATQVVVPADEDYATSCAFLDEFSLQPQESLVNADFLSLRAKPLYQVDPGEYEIICPAFLIETIYKGLYFKLSALNDAATPKLLGTLNFRGTYCNLFSEQYLLNSLLNELFARGGVHFSGSEILAGQYFAGTGDSEPDYYFRSGRNTLLVESKDVLLRKEARAGDNFNSYVEEVRKKFYYDHDRRGRVEKKAVLQLIGNVERVLTTGMPFDPGCLPAEAIVHPLLLVHDRQFNLPGLNSLVNTWFQQELAKLAATGLPVERVRPLVVLDVDTLLALREPLQRRRIVLFDALEAYHRYVNPSHKTVHSPEAARELVLRQCHPFSLFLQNRAKERGLSLNPRRSMQEIIQALQLTP